MGFIGGGAPVRTDIFNPQQLEMEVMAHRYLYYVLAEAYLPDHIYDQIERGAREVCPADSPVHKLGSSLASDYTPEQKEFAEGLLASRRKLLGGV